jgi:hypothetical protein
MAAHRRTTSTRVHRIRRRVHRAWRWTRRSRAARHLPFTAYCVITLVGMGYTLVLISRATG